MLDTQPKRHHLGPSGEWVSEWTARAMPDLAGSLIGTDTTHRFIEMTVGLGGSQCLLCFGWFDDHRHFLTKFWQDTDDAVCQRYEDIKEWHIFDDDRHSSYT